MMKYRVRSFLALWGLSGMLTSALAAPCAYDISPLPSVSGVVSRITGEGILLRDGTPVVLPESLLPYVRLDQSVTFYGLRAREGQTLWAFALKKVESPDAPVCPFYDGVRKGAYPGSPAYDVIQTGKPAADSAGQW